MNRKHPHDGTPILKNLKADEAVTGEYSTSVAKEKALNNSSSVVLVEVICERYHCVMYDYAITTVEFVAEDFEGKVEVRPVVRRGNRENAERFMELCRLNGRHLSVPTILIDGRVAFTDVPGPEELRNAIKESLAMRDRSIPAG